MCIRDRRRTLRRGLAHGGIPFEIMWKSRKLEKPKITVLCDVSQMCIRDSSTMVMSVVRRESTSPVRSWVKWVRSSPSTRRKTTLRISATTRSPSL